MLSSVPVKIWNKLADAPLVWRTVIKGILLLAVVFVVLFPRPRLFVEQLGHYWNAENLIQPEMPAMAEINREIDALLPANYSQETELKTIERFVYKKIRYRYDWYTWGNIDYWPTASEVWQMKSEDCDGRAILAASILRARGYHDAKIVGNLNHVWVALDSIQLMGPEADQNFRRINGKTILTLPSLRTLSETVAFLSRFPALRSLVIFFAAALLTYHPCRSLSGFFAVTTLGLTGFLLLVDWGNLRLSQEPAGSNPNFYLGLGLMVLSLGLALTMSSILQWKFFRSSRWTTKAAVDLPQLPSAETDPAGA